MTRSRILLSELDLEMANTRRALERGQLTVYLRLLDVPVPALYGPSADERPA